MDSKNPRYTLRTAEGCRRLVSLMIIIILVASLFARLIDTDFGKLKVEKLTIDSRGATLNCEIYYPAGTSDEDSLPAILFTHGGGINSSSYRQYAYELARRGFVTMMVDAYGNGLSETPVYDDSSSGEQVLDDTGAIHEVDEESAKQHDRGNTHTFDTPLGIYDALQYLKTLKIVDPYRIGIAGHSMGSFRAARATEQDCYYYNYNDIMVNVLYNEFGQKFTEEEIYQDAAELAAARLNEDQLAYYNYLADVYKELYDTRVVALCNLGMDSWYASLFAHLSAFEPKTLSVAGYDVVRACKCNVAFLCGAYELQSVFSSTDQVTKDGFYTDEDVNYEEWYAIDDIAGTSEQLGAIGVRSDELAAAAENRSLRLYTTVKNAHSEEYFSTEVVAKLADYFETTLNVNSGMPSGNQHWPIRVAMNCIAMFAMLALIFPLTVLLSKREFFTPIMAERAPEDKRPVVSKKIFAIVAGLTVIASLFATHIGLKNYATLFSKFLTNGAIFKVAGGVNGGKDYIIMMALASVVFIAIYAVTNKKKTGNSGLSALNVKLNVVTVLKTLLVGVIIFLIQYGLLEIIEYFFDEDFRLWQTVFDEMRPERWGAIFPNFIVLLPCYLLIGAATNYYINDEIPAWKDMLIAIVIGSLGVWICSLITQYQFRFAWTGTPWTDYLVGYGLNLLVPLTIYISRKLYKITNSIWAGAVINSLLVCWTWISFNGYQELYTAQNWISNVLGS